MSEVLGLYRVKLMNSKGKTLMSTKVIAWSRREAYFEIAFSKIGSITHNLWDATRIRDAKPDEKQGRVLEKNDLKRK